MEPNSKGLTTLQIPRGHSTAGPRPGLVQQPTWTPHLPGQHLLIFQDSPFSRVFCEPLPFPAPSWPYCSRFGHSSCPLRPLSILCNPDAVTHRILYCKYRWISLSRPGSLNLWTTDIVGQITLCCGSCLVHCGIFSTIPRLSPLDETSIPLPSSSDKQNCCQPNVP